MDDRIEKDTMGEIKVPGSAMWGAQTQRAIANFQIGKETMPQEIIHAYAYLKEACAIANQKLSTEERDAITQACHAIYSGELNEQFPISLWQTGSGTQTNMNVCEVIAHHAKQNNVTLHPNDHVNASQSSNDTFPSAMHIALSKQIIEELLPTLVKLKTSLENKINAFDGIIRIGRTHMQDAVPISLSQSFSAYHQFIAEAIDHIHESLDGLYELPLGSTAVGTGINAPKGFADKALKHLAKTLKIPFTHSKNPFASLSGHSAILNTSAQLSTLAANLNKMACDIRLLGSGPRCGLGELILPSNEPGSSIMPGKVNPTQCEAMTMVAIQVMANHQLILTAGSLGQFELNTYKPVIAHNVLQSCRLLTDVCKSFDEHLLQNLQANTDKITENLNKSLMLITALKPIIGYDNCAKIAYHAHENNTSLREAALALDLISAQDFDKHLDPKTMV